MTNNSSADRTATEEAQSRKVQDLVNRLSSLEEMHAKLQQTTEKMTEPQSHKDTQDTINSLADKQTEILKMEERMETKLKHFDDRNQKAIQHTEKK